jgi:hypothetical protein
MINKSIESEILRSQSPSFVSEIYQLKDEMEGIIIFLQNLRPTVVSVWLLPVPNIKDAVVVQAHLGGEAICTMVHNLDGV